MKNKSNLENFITKKRFYLNMDSNDFLMEFIEITVKVKIWKSLLYIALPIILVSLVVVSKNLYGQQANYISCIVILGITIITFFFIRWIIREYYNLTWKKTFMVEIKNLRKIRGE